MASLAGLGRGLLVDGHFLWVNPDAGAGCVALTDRKFSEWVLPPRVEFTDAVLTDSRHERARQ
ncbi:hypothetical protein [Streptomyces celluloflavus]|uniref:hypothetical protein n=1 Tax=Streptomyces celluloflavus TaxID=58344 RepID=UPI0036C9E90A